MLTMRMGVGAVGGVLDQTIALENNSDSTTLQEETTKDPNSTVIRESDEAKMWDEWGKRVEVWTIVKQIADRAVGSMVAANSSQPKSDKSTLEPTAIPWSTVYRAWSAQRSSRDLRKAWMKESSGKTLREQDEEDDEDEDDMEKENDSDILERIKQDPSLEQHEQKLLPCIVDAGMLATTTYMLTSLTKSALQHQCQPLLVKFICRLIPSILCGLLSHFHFFIRQHFSKVYSKSTG